MPRRGARPKSARMPASTRATNAGAHSSEESGGARTDNAAGAEQGATEAATDFRKKSPFYGAVDGFDPAVGIRGWVVANDGLDGVVRVEAVCGGERIGSVLAVSTRPDISKLLGRELLCGFTFRWADFDSQTVLRLAESGDGRVRFLVGNHKFRLACIPRDITLGQIAETLLRASGALADDIVAEIYASDLFDHSYYTQSAGINVNRLAAIKHYIVHGEKVGLSPSRAFDIAFYRQLYQPFVKHPILLFDYIQFGRAERRYTTKDALESDVRKIEDSGLFDHDYYYARQRGSLDPELRDLEQHLAYGWSRGTRARRDFDDLFYFNSYQEVRDSGLVPLVHYAERGRHQWLMTNAGMSTIRHNSFRHSNRDEFLQVIAGARRVAIIASHSNCRKLYNYQKTFINNLASAGYPTILVHAEGDIALEESTATVDNLACLIRRDNTGYDFGSWSTAFAVISEHRQHIDEIVILNDSIFGRIDLIFPALKRVEGEFVCLTDSYEHRYHAQSYFLAFRRGAIREGVVMDFFENYPYPSAKDQVIALGELALTKHMIANGVELTSMCPYERVASIWLDELPRTIELVRTVFRDLGLSNQRRLDNRIEVFSDIAEGILANRPLNPSHFFWRPLIKYFSYPFIKRELIMKNPASVPDLPLAFADEDVARLLDSTDVLQYVRLEGGSPMVHLGRRLDGGMARAGRSGVRRMIKKAFTG